MNDHFCGPRGKSTPSSAERKARESSSPTAMAPLLTVDLHAHVVAAAVVAGGADEDEGAVVEGEHGGGGVDVARLAEERRALVGAGRVDRGDLASGDEPQDVEVVDVAVAEDAARRRDVVGVRRGLVVGGRADRVDEPELAGVDRGLARCGSRCRTAAGTPRGPASRTRRRGGSARWSPRGWRRPASRRTSGCRARRRVAAAPRGRGSRSR